MLPPDFMRLVGYLFGARREDKANLSLLKVFTVSCEAIIWALLTSYLFCLLLEWKGRDIKQRNPRIRWWGFEGIE